MKRATKVLLVIAAVLAVVASAAALAVPRYLQHRRYLQAESAASAAFVNAWRGRDLPESQFKERQERYEAALSRFRDLDAASGAEAAAYSRAQACHDLLSEYRWSVEAGKSPAQAEYEALASVRGAALPDRCVLIE